MTTQKYTTKINRANRNNNSLKVTIPSQIVDLLQLSTNDTLKWTVNPDGTVHVEKLEL